MTIVVADEKPDDADVAEHLTDESRWMRNDGVDSMNWPKPITVRPVEVRSVKPWRKVTP